MHEHKAILTRFAVGQGTIVQQFGEFFEVLASRGWRLVTRDGERLHYCVATIAHIGGNDWFNARPLTGRNVAIVDIVESA